MFESNNGLQQGDSLPCILFNLALEKVIRQSEIRTMGAIFNKSTQILAYVIDIDVICRSEGGVKKALK